MQEVLLGSSDASSMVVQLGDLGTGASSGNRDCFERAKQYLHGFGCPYAVITGNHDLEGVDFDTDAANLAAWRYVFQQNHFWAKDIGPCVLFGLSTTRYRSNALSHHEVHIDEEQLAWFERALRQVAPAKPAVVFTHAPPMGCGLKVLNSLHVKNRCSASMCIAMIGVRHCSIQGPLHMQHCQMWHSRPYHCPTHMLASSL